MRNCLDQSSAMCMPSISQYHCERRLQVKQYLIRTSCPHQKQQKLVGHPLKQAHCQTGWIEKRLLRRSIQISPLVLQVDLRIMLHVSNRKPDALLKFHARKLQPVHNKGILCQKRKPNHRHIIYHPMDSSPLALVTPNSGNIPKRLSHPPQEILPHLFTAVFSCK